MSVEAHVDGSVLNNGMYNAQAGYGVYWTGGNLTNIARRVEGQQTVSRAEAEAVRAAVNQANSAGYRSVVIYTDSEENLRGLDGRHTVNLDIWNQINQLKNQGMRVQGVKIARGQNSANGLAQQGARK